MATIVTIAAARAAEIMVEIKRMRAVKAIISVNSRICLSKELESKNCPKKVSEKEHFLSFTSYNFNVLDRSIS